MSSCVREEARKVSAATLYLSGDALLWWRRHTLEEGTGAPSIQTWKEFKAELRKRFYPANVEHEARKKLRSLKQGGRIREYISQFTSLMLCISDMSDADRLFSFLDGLKPWAEQEVRRRDVKTLTEALSVAEKLPEFDKRPEGQHLSSEDKEGSKGKKTKEDSGGESKVNTQQKGKKWGDRDRKGKGPKRTCFICDGDHLMRDCPKRHALNAILKEGSAGQIASMRRYEVAETQETHSGMTLNTAGCSGTSCVEDATGGAGGQKAPATNSTPRRQGAMAGAAISNNHKHGAGKPEATWETCYLGAMRGSKVDINKTRGRVQTEFIAHGSNQRETDSFLSRPFLNAVSQPDNPLTQRIREAMQHDPDVLKLTKAVSLGETKRFWVENDLLCTKGGRVYVPRHGGLRKDIMKECHDTLWAGHPGQKRTIALVSEKFYWPGLAMDVEVYVRTCLVCQQDKAERRRPGGLLQPLPIAERPWDSVSMDFILGIKESGGLSAIYVVVDRFSKYATFVALSKRCTASEVAKVFFQTL
ncbi:hypothetical protein H6P81_006659 [Aristolochia fimbriata]|uniref:Polyprotein n=1 Tax=Aristolochia fimbriata TaxID=158543 RepID=A0AAV7EXX6_ARIFI|nr:hypothetical protein H6P81_006659 [Aristolochia fimbriata]